MLPMSIGAATSIRVGHRLGEGNVEGAAIAARVGLMVAVALSLVTALMTVLLREQVALLYTDNRAVIEIALQLLLLAAIYQVTDAIQVVAAGALRGYKDMAGNFQSNLYRVLDFRFTYRLYPRYDGLDCGTNGRSWILDGIHYRSVIGSNHARC